MAGNRVRVSIEVLQREYAKNNKAPLDNLVRAFEGIFNKDPTDDYSFHKIAGFHGAPFRGAGWGNPAWWGGYCHHGNVLFPTWHRAYLLRLEDALRSVPGCADVTLPYWDEQSLETQIDGVPWCFLQLEWTLDDPRAKGRKRTIKNPLRSYTFAASVWDNVDTGPKDTDYTKKKGYETVRYPFSGLVGPYDIKETEKHNAEVMAGGIEKANHKLNDNIQNWLAGQIHPPGVKDPIPTNTFHKYDQCLDAPNYTVFSNTTSAMQWNEEHYDVKKWAKDDPVAKKAVVPLESPHNDMHLAVGGFDAQGQVFSEERGANGDMGENDTAAFDPLFYFHHCYIDLKFWEWQEKHYSTDTLEIIKGYPGTNSVDSQGPTPGVAANVWLDLDTPLDPFEIRLGTGVMFKSRDLVNIHKQLGYSYDSPPKAEPRPDPMPLPPTQHLPTIGLGLGADHGSGGQAGGDDDPEQDSRRQAKLEHLRRLHREAEEAPTPQPHIRIAGLNRATFAGSFAVHVTATFHAPGEAEGDEPTASEPVTVATDSVLSRWHVSGCANCQTHLAYRAYLPLPKSLALPLDEDKLDRRTHKLLDRLHRRTTRRDYAGRLVSYHVVVQERKRPGERDGKPAPPVKGTAPRLDIGHMGGQAD